MDEILASIRRMIATEPAKTPASSETRVAPVRADAVPVVPAMADRPSVLIGDGSSVPDDSDLDDLVGGEAALAVPHDSISQRLADALAAAPPKGPLPERLAADTDDLDDLVEAPAVSAEQPAVGDLKMPALNSLAAVFGRMAVTAPAPDAVPDLPNVQSQPVAQPKPFDLGVLPPSRPEHLVAAAFDRIMPSFTPVQSLAAAQAPPPSLPPIETVELAPAAAAVAVAVEPEPEPLVAPVAAVPEATPVPVATEAAGSAAVSGTPLVSDDAVAKLLQPMLRQWLDDNMPRIVEKALRNGLDGGTKAG